MSAPASAAGREARCGRPRSRAGRGTTPTPAPGGQAGHRRGAEGEAARADAPPPPARDGIRERAEPDLPRDAREAEDAERPGALLPREADFLQIARLVHLH